MEVRKMRLLRHKYGISCRELVKACGLTTQRIYDIELNANVELEAETKAKIKAGFAAVIAKRRLALTNFEQDYEAHQETLLDAVEETTYEL